ncbi:MAG: hypothetical protein AAGJ35_07050, partial [Myxococcota bacterium]
VSSEELVSRPVLANTEVPGSVEIEVNPIPYEHTEVESERSLVEDGVLSKLQSEGLGPFSTEEAALGDVPEGTKAAEYVEGGGNTPDVGEGEDLSLVSEQASVASIEAEVSSASEEAEGTQTTSGCAVEYERRVIRALQAFSHCSQEQKQAWMDRALALEKQERFEDIVPTHFHRVVDLRVERKVAPALEEVESLFEGRKPAYTDLHIGTIIDHLFLSEHEKRDAHKVLAKITANLQALSVLDEHGQQIAGELIGQIRGMDGLFVYHCLMNFDMDYGQIRQFVEFLVDHDVIQKRLNRKDEDKKREWIRERLRERRQTESQVSWDDVREEYEQKFPRELEWIEHIHQDFVRQLPHQELHGGKMFKRVWTEMEDHDLTFMEFVLTHELELEEGSLFSYLARVMKSAKLLFEITAIPEFAVLERRILEKLAVIDARIVDDLW